MAGNGRRVLTEATLGAGAVTVIEKIHHPGLRIGLHAHDRPYLTWVASGCFREETRRASEVVGPGCVLANLDGTPHANTYLETAVRSLVISLQAVPAGVPARGCWPQGSEVARWAAAIDLELGISDALQPTVLGELLGALFDSMASPRVPTRQADWLERVRARLDEAPLERPHLPVLAAYAGVHPDHLARSFRHRYRSTVGQYVRRRRLDWAAAKLVSTCASLADVALEAGFSDQSHFTRLFRRRFGLPPSRYRRALHSGCD